MFQANHCTEKISLQDRPLDKRIQNDTHKFFCETSVNKDGELVVFAQNGSNFVETKTSRNENRGKKDFHHRDLFLTKPGQKRNTEWYSSLPIIDELIIANGDIFDVDPCSPVKGETAPVPAKRHYTQEDDGLSQIWTGTTYMNCPYANISAWAKKAVESVWCSEMGEPPTEFAAHKETPDAEIVIGLIPARTNTQYWRKYISKHAKVFFFSGKVVFRQPDGNGNYVVASSGFPQGVALVVWGNHTKISNHLKSLDMIDGHEIYERSHPSIPDLPVQYWTKRNQQ
ncbi:DNA N-6-adenine-methyltransferase [Terasakiella pusilla]|uniref:DNA N-6-adenine-methyltransferase n=1 Tax=Terasakiella pusilla TaxID=64973 RepID=UPI003AA9855B